MGAGKWQEDRGRKMKKRNIKKGKMGDCDDD
jgi:hypothetical protein